MKSSHVNSSRVHAALDEIARLTNVRLDKTHLFIEARGAQKSRMKLSVENAGSTIGLVRILDKYWWAHGGLAFAFFFSALLIIKEGLAETWGACLAASVAAAGGYGVTAWFNQRAIQTNPILSYDSGSKTLSIPAYSMQLSLADVCFLMALSSVGARDNKPETSRTELKMFVHHNGQLRSVLLAKGGNGGVKGYDFEIEPFVRALGVAFLHVDRPMNNRPITVSRVM